MKEKYIDQYGIDSLPNLIIASENKLDVFLTLNEGLIEDREELEKRFNIKIRTPEELDALSEKNRGKNEKSISFGDNTNPWYKDASLEKDGGKK